VFASLVAQVLPIAGSRGLHPIRLQLAKIREDYPTPHRFFYFPTLLWLTSQDWALRGAVLAGCLSSITVIVGGAGTWFFLFVCWAIFLSLDVAIGLAYPWDCLLLEAGFLSLFLPAIGVLADIRAAAQPLPVVACAHHFLLFRVMFGFGKYKFIGKKNDERRYLKSLMVNQPIPSPLGWLAFRLPVWCSMLGLAYAFLAEMVLPFFGLVPGDFRLIAAAGIVGLMAGIQLCGNYGYFNLLVSVLCVTLLDTQVSLASPLPPDTNLWTAALVYAVLALWYLSGLLCLPFNSWCTQAWMYWPSLVQAKQRWVRALAAYFRALVPFRVVHSYGVFPAASRAPLRWVECIEGSNDGETWLPYEYRFQPTVPASRPRFVAPHHPRLDHNVFYDSFGGTLNSFVESVFSVGNPYYFRRRPEPHIAAQRLLEGSRLIAGMFRRDPFPDAPPKIVRVSCYAMKATTLKELRETGAWWTLTRTDTDLDPEGRDASSPAEVYTDPELFHWDQIVWKQRAPRLRKLIDMARTGEDPTKALLDTSQDIGLREIEAFWHDFIPAIAAPPDWSRLRHTVQKLRERYGPSQLAGFERIYARYSLALWARIEPHYLGRAAPRLEVESFFHVGLLIYYLIAHGRETFDGVAREPSLATECKIEPSDGLYYMALFQYESLAMQARKQRQLDPINAINHKPGLPGFVALLQFLRDNLFDEEAPPTAATDTAGSRSQSPG
jgi:hypothetical protein